jgi:hypothetical protein
MGPHHESQRDYVRGRRRTISLAAAGEPLAVALRELLENDSLRAERARAAREVAEAQRGSAARAVAALVELGLWPA